MIDWAKHLKAQRRSGLSVAEYCRRENLSGSQFLYWRRKGTTAQAGQFVPIGSKGEPKFKITTRAGTEISVPSDFEAAALKRLLEVIDA